MPESQTEPTQNSVNFHAVFKRMLVLALSAIIVSGSVLMIGPPILFLVPFAFLSATAFAINRSYWSLVFFGYPLTFGFVYAWNGYHEIPGFGATASFAISVTIGLLAWVMIALGLWKVLLREHC